MGLFYSALNEPYMLRIWGYQVGFQGSTSTFEFTMQDFSSFIEVI
jgi:hypothetical protein